METNTALIEDSSSERSYVCANKSYLPPPSLPQSASSPPPLPSSPAIHHVHHVHPPCPQTPPLPPATARRVLIIPGIVLPPLPRRFPLLPGAEPVRVGAAPVLLTRESEYRMIITGGIMESVWSGNVVWERLREREGIYDVEWSGLLGEGGMAVGGKELRVLRRWRQMRSVPEVAGGMGRIWWIHYSLLSELDLAGWALPERGRAAAEPPDASGESLKTWIES